MSQKSIATVLLLIASALGGPVAVDHAIEVQEEIIASVAIEGPSEVEVGELVQLKVTGDRPSWLTPVDDAYVADSLCILSFREPGEYEVIASSIAGRATRVVRHNITVGKPVPPAPPEPEPAPEPVVKIGGELTTLVYSWCVEAKADTDVCKELGDNFVYAASTSETIDELLEKVATRNRKVEQRSVRTVLAKIQQHLYDELAGEGFVEHQCAFDEIGQGFLQYASRDAGATGGFWKYNG
jgi:hypothetical protein